MFLLLNEIIQYKNPHVCKRYEKEFPNNTFSAEKAFLEMTKYLWLSKKHHADKKQYPKRKALQFVCGIYPEMSEIDDMWHTFLLFTKDYQDFCQRYFGEFMHHEPNTDDVRNVSDTFKTELTRYLNYIYDTLGEQTVRCWFSTLLT